MEHSNVLKRRILILGIAILLLLALTATVMAAPPYPEGPERQLPSEPADQLPARRAPTGKTIDQPNIQDYLRNEERQRLLEAGDTAGAEALALAQDDRVLVILVEFAGTDVFTWEAGVSTWDPYGRADPNESTGIEGDCSLIITQTQTFTYTGPLHNEIPRPLSEEDRSGDSIWTEDFSPGWFEGFLFDDGVVFNYTREDGSVVHEDFTGKSVQDYFLDLSGGAYEMGGDVIGWVQVPHSTWYYDADECPGDRSGLDSQRGGVIPGAGTTRTLVRHALDAVNAISDTIPGFDWANYDLDGNGIIDRLWLVHAGYGEEDAPVLLNRTDYGEAAVWSHSSSVSPPYEVAPGIAAGPYIIMPENGGMSVFAHEAGHNLGADDLYAYGAGETSAGFWTLQADSWTGYPIGFEPPAYDPWHLERWGWLHPAHVTDTNQVYEITLGQASRFPDEEGMVRGAKIELPDGELPLAVPVWQGTYYWWGGKKDLANARMTTASPIDLTGATDASLAFDLVYDIEDEWDFLWVQVSTDGVNWPVENTLTNTNTQCIHNPSWIGGQYGFPEDLCGAGLGGFYGYNANWPDPELQEFDLSAYVGQNIWLRFWFMTDWGTTYTGAFVDNVVVEVDSATVLSDDAEGGDANWVYEDPWIRTDGVMPYTHNLYLQWRNLNDESGYDSALADERWRFGPANTGLLVWYNNNFYTDNEIWNYLFDDPSLGPKGRMLVVDAHPEPYRDPDLVAMGFDNEGGNLTSRGQMRDAPFTLVDTVDFDQIDTSRAGAQEHSYEGRPAANAFHDALGYYPGAEYVRRGAYYPLTQFKWVTKQWDASAVVPATSPYPLNADGYDGTAGNPSASDREFRFRCTPYLEGSFAGALSCYWFGTGVGLDYEGGTGNPGDYGLQYGWHVELIEEAADHTWAKVRVWNATQALDDDFAAMPTSTYVNKQIDYSYKVNFNAGSPLAQGLVVIPLDTSKVEYVAGSAYGGLVELPSGVSAQQAAALYAEGGRAALEEMAVSQAGETGALAWSAGPLATGEGSLDAGFSVKTTAEGPYTLVLEALGYDGASQFQATEATPVQVRANSRLYLPLMFKEGPLPPAYVTLLHTNDFHGNLETDYKGRGGSAYMASVISDIRAEVGEDQVFLLDAGDVFFGGPPISQLLTGTSTIDIYNMLGYDVANFGNHEFDKGQAVLQDRVTQSDFPWIGANIVVSGTDWTNPSWVEPYVILSKDGVNLGVIGVDTDETPLVTLKGTTDGLVFKDLTATILHYYDEVMAQSDALIVVAHMGTEESGPYKGLETVAQELIDAGKPVDLMIGGHQHEALEAPVMVGDTAIIEAGYYGRYLGRADVLIDPTTKSLTLEDFELITINNELPADPDVAARVQYWADQVGPLVGQVVGHTNIDLVRVYDRESNMGDLVADSMLWKADLYDDGLDNDSVDIAFTNAGGLRADIEIPMGATLPYTVTWGDTFNVLPFANTLYLMDLTGAQVRELLDQAASLYKGILQTSGATWTWYNDCDCDAPTTWGTADIKVGGAPLESDATYRVVTNNFLAPGGDDFTTFADGTNRWDTYYDMHLALNEYIATITPIDAADIPMDRIIKLDLDKVISILHTNDTHGVWPAGDYHGTLDGFAYLASHIKAERAKNPNTILLDAGDTFQGNAFAQYFRNATTNPIAGGMNLLDYDAFTLGNHEFNFGPTTFATMLGQLDAPILGTINLDDDGSYGFINTDVQDYVNLTVDGVKVTVFGLTNPRIYRYELPTNIPGLTFYSGLTTGFAAVPTILAAEEPDVLVGLTHMGYSPYGDEIDSDKLLAEGVAGIDVIIGGHSHSFLDPAVMVSSTITNPTGTLVAQTGRYAMNLGKVNIGLVDDGAGGWDVVMREGYLLPAADAELDAEMVAYLAPFEADLEAYTSTEIGQTTAPIDALQAYTEETTGANLQTDAAFYELTSNGVAIDFYLSGAMSDRAVAAGATPGSPVTLTVDDMYTLMPYENSLFAMDMNGPQLKTVLERAYRNYWYYKYDPGNWGGFSHYTTCMLDINEGGLITYTGDSTTPPNGNNVAGLSFNNGADVVDFADAATYYKVGTVNYLAAGSCNFNDAGVTLWPLSQNPVDTQFYVRDSVIDYITAMGTVSPAIEGRLVLP